MRHSLTFIAGLLFCLTAIQTASGQDWPASRGRRHGLQVRVGQSYHLPADQTVSRPVIVVGGSATLDGRVDDDVLVVGGDVRIGPTARVRGDVTSIGGGVQVADGADVTGEIHDVSVLWPDIRIDMVDWFPSFGDVWWGLFGLAGSLFRLTLLIIAVSLLTLVAPGWIRGIEQRVTTAPLVSLFIGLATQMLFVPVVVVVVVGLIVSLVGIPLLLALPFVFLALGVIWLAGFAGVAAHIGARLRPRPTSNTPPTIDAIVGVAAIGSLTLIGHVLSLAPSVLAPFAAACGGAGLLVEYLAWTIGLGSALAVPVRNGRRDTPPPVPTPAPAPATW
jgi:hypothetical protein